MEIVIDLPKRLIDYMNKPGYDEHLDREFDMIIRGAVMEGTPLPKGHGRLIDGDALAGKGGITESFLRIFADTIIEADTEREEE